jgi:NH3-dependent NAD+ synthetase
MKVHNPQTKTKLKQSLRTTLDTIRAKRNFDPEPYINAKSSLLNEYMDHHRLDACVIGVSGGIDSALVLAMVHHASKQKKSPIKKIIPLLLPVHTKGATNQKSALARGKAITKKLGLDGLDWRPHARD